MESGLFSCHISLLRSRDRLILLPELDGLFRSGCARGLEQRRRPETFAGVTAHIEGRWHSPSFSSTFQLLSFCCVLVYRVSQSNVSFALTPAGACVSCFPNFILL